METDKEMNPELARMTLDAWRHAAPRTQPLDAIQLAAWLEDRLDEAEAAEVEAQLATDPALWDALLGGRDMQHTATTAHEIAAARALVQAPWWQRNGNAALKQVIAALLLMLSAGVGAFELGEALAGISAIQQYDAMNTMLNYEMLVTPGEK